MRWTRWALVVIVSTVFGGVPSGALAKTIIINPPGSAGANEYSEVIPSGAGNVSPPSGGDSGPVSTTALAGLGNGQVGAARLARLGRDGRAAAALAVAGAPSPVPDAASARPGSGPAASPPVTGGSAPSGLAHALTGSDAGGLGLALPMLLGTCLIGAIGIVASRVRRRGGPTELKV